MASLINKYKLIFFLVVLLSMKVPISLSMNIKNCVKPKSIAIFYREKKDDSVINIRMLRNTKNNIKIEIIIPVITTIISCLVIWLNLKKQIKASFRRLLMSDDIKYLNDYRDNLAKFLAEFEQMGENDYARLREGNYISDEHKLLEIKIIIMSSPENSLQKQIINNIYSFRQKDLLDSIGLAQLRDSLIDSTRKYLNEARRDIRT
jgi:hypothetical protein